MVQLKSKMICLTVFPKQNKKKIHLITADAPRQATKSAIFLILSESLSVAKILCYTSIKKNPQNNPDPVHGMFGGPAARM